MAFRSTARRPVPRAACSPAAAVPRRGRGTALLLSGLTLTALAATPSAAEPAASGPRTDVRVNQDTAGVRQHIDHSMSVNPTRPSNVVVTDSNRIDNTCFVHTSFDGGRTWRSNRLELAKGVSRCGLTSAAFSRDGSFYVAYNAVNASGSRNLFLARSDDGGRTFALNRDVGVSSVFSTALAVDTSTGPRRGTVYLAYIPTSRPPSRRATVVSTSDRGATFSSPVTVAPVTEQVTGRVQLDVGAGGEVYVAYQDFTEAFAQVVAIVFTGLQDGPDIFPFTAHVARSTDGGRSFSDVEVEDQVGGGIIANVQTVLPFPVVAADPRDGRRAYLAITDRRRGGDWDVYVYRTTDGGATWTPARRLNDDPLSPRRDQVMPWVDVAPDGRVDVVWLDRRADPENRRAQPYGTSSYDGGATWTPNRPVSPTTFDAGVGSVGQGETSFLGDRLAMVSGPTGALVAWTDTRNGNQDNGTDDLYTRFVPAGFPTPVRSAPPAASRASSSSPADPQSVSTRPAPAQGAPRLAATGGSMPGVAVGLLLFALVVGRLSSVTRS